MWNTSHTHEQSAEPGSSGKTSPPVYADPRGPTRRSPARLHAAVNTRRSSSVQWESAWSRCSGGPVAVRVLPGTVHVAALRSAPPPPLCCRALRVCCQHRSAQSLCSDQRSRLQLVIVGRCFQQQVCDRLRHRRGSVGVILGSPGCCCPPVWLLGICTRHPERAQMISCPRLEYFSPKGLPDLFKVKDPNMR